MTLMNDHNVQLLFEVGQTLQIIPENRKKTISRVLNKSVRKIAEWIVILGTSDIDGFQDDCDHVTEKTSRVVIQWKKSHDIGEMSCRLGCPFDI